MEGVGYNPISFEKESSLFGVLHVNPLRVCPPISYTNKGQRCNVSPENVI